MFSNTPQGATYGGAPGWQAQLSGGFQRHNGVPAALQADAASRATTAASAGNGAARSLTYSAPTPRDQPTAGPAGQLTAEQRVEQIVHHLLHETGLLQRFQPVEERLQHLEQQLARIAQQQEGMHTRMDDVDVAVHNLGHSLSESDSRLSKASADVCESVYSLSRQLEGLHHHTVGQLKGVLSFGGAEGPVPSSAQEVVQALGYGQDEGLDISMFKLVVPLPQQRKVIVEMVGAEHMRALKAAWERMYGQGTVRPYAHQIAVQRVGTTHKVLTFIYDEMNRRVPMGDRSVEVSGIAQLQYSIHQGAPVVARRPENPAHAPSPAQVEWYSYPVEHHVEGGAQFSKQPHSLSLPKVLELSMWALNKPQRRVRTPGGLQEYEPQVQRASRAAAPMVARPAQPGMPPPPPRASSPQSQQQQWAQQRAAAHQHQQQAASAMAAAAQQQPAAPPPYLPGLAPASASSSSSMVAAAAHTAAAAAHGAVAAAAALAAGGNDPAQLPPSDGDTHMGRPAPVRRASPSGPAGPAPQRRNMQQGGGGGQGRGSPPAAISGGRAVGRPSGGGAGQVQAGINPYALLAAAPLQQLDHTSPRDAFEAAAAATAAGHQ